MPYVQWTTRYGLIVAIALPLLAAGALPGRLRVSPGGESREKRNN